MKKDLHDQRVRHIIIKFQDTKKNGNILNPVGGWGTQIICKKIGNRNGTKFMNNSSGTRTMDSFLQNSEGNDFQSRISNTKYQVGINQERRIYGILETGSQTEEKQRQILGWQWREVSRWKSCSRPREKPAQTRKWGSSTPGVSKWNKNKTDRWPDTFDQV